GAGPDRYDRIDGQLAMCIELDLDTEIGPTSEGSNEVDDLERAFAVAVLHGRDVRQIVVFLSRRVVQPAQDVTERVTGDEDNGLTVARNGRAADRAAPGRSQCLYRRIHDERNC